MRTLKSCAVLFGLICLLACRAEETAPPPERPSEKVAPAETTVKPSLSITRIGPEDIDPNVDPQRTDRIDLTADTVEVAGQAWNFDPSDEIAVFYRSLGASSWTDAGASPAVPGGLFAVSGVHFPGTGDYKVIAGLFRVGDSVPSGEIPDAHIRDYARALSREVLVRVTGPQEEEEAPDPEVKSVNGTPLNPQQSTLVPAWGDVLLQAPDASPDAKVYLGISDSSSDRVYLQGPAQRSSNSEFLLSGVVFENPDDPRNVHLSLIAVVSDVPLLPPGAPFDRSWLRIRTKTSRSKAIVVDENKETANNQRVPYIAITRIGSHILSGPQAPDQSLSVESGDAVEVGQYERVPEGANLWILTRPAESNLWLTHGPLMLSGRPSNDESGEKPSAAVWVCPSTRFEHATSVESGQENELAKEDFEIRAVVSTKHLPEGWIDANAWEGGRISAGVRVKTKPHQQNSTISQKIAITRIGETDVDPETETVVGAAEPIAIIAEKELPPPSRIYLAWHPRGDSSWTLVEAMPQEKSYAVPAISFVSSRQEVHYELMAVVTRGEMPEEQMRYRDLAHSFVDRSLVIRVRYEPKSSGGFTRWVRQLGSSQNEDSGGPELPPEDRKSPWRVPMKIWIVLLAALLVLIVGLALLEWKRGFIEPLARRGADRIDQGVKALEAQLRRFSQTRPALFLLGVVLAAVLLFVIAHYYLPLYVKAVAIVMSLPHRESEGLAIWLILLTALAGIFLELTADPEYGITRNLVGMRIGLGLNLAFILLGLMIFQALFYYTFLNKTAAGMIPLLGGIAFFLIAFVEAMTFFFVIRLTLLQLEPITIRFVRLLLVLLSLFFRTIARFVQEISQGKPKKEEVT